MEPYGFSTVERNQNESSLDQIDRQDAVGLGLNYF
jgi:hypothetical protein